MNNKKEEREQKVKWLNAGKWLRLTLIGLYAERQEKRSRAEYGGISYDNIGQSGNGTQRKFDDLAEIEANIRETEQELIRVEAEIRAAISEVRNPVYQTYLRMRFLAYMSEPQIAMETGYAIDSVHGYIRKNSLDCIKFTPNNPCSHP